MVSKDCKFSTFEEEAEVLERRAGEMQLLVEGEVFLFSLRQLLGEESQEPSRNYCITELTWESEASTAREI